MPRRRRPPLTTLEIGAYTAGGRLCRRYLAEDVTGPPSTWALDVLARDDAQVMCAMGARRFWRWFWVGWEDNLRSRWSA